MAKEQPDFFITIPIGEIIRANGEVDQVLETKATSDEAMNAAEKDLRERYGRVEEVSGNGRGRTFGIAKWDKCLWKPTGPKPNWAQPENPSKN